MDNKDKVSFYLAANSKYFPTTTIPELKKILEGLDEDRFLVVTSTNYTDPMTALIVSILIGNLGIDRFIVGDIGLGIAKLLTAGGCLIWWFVDLFLIMDRAKETNYNKLIQAAAIIQ